MFGMGQGGVNTLLDISAPVVVKAAPGAVYTITVYGTLTAGALVINDCTTTGAAAAANQIASIPYASLQPGTPVPLYAFPCLTGIVISAVPTGATVGIAYA